MTLICDKCDGKITKGSKFCPHCGDPVDKKDKPLSEISIGENYAFFEFGYSTSQSYEKAVAICSNVPTYTVFGEGKNITHQVTIPTTEIDLLINIYDLIGNWKSSKMLINGRVRTKRDLTYYGLGCFRTMREAPNWVDYCYGVHNETERNIWGCKRLEMPIYPWGGGWLEYGALDKDGVWHFDKRRIKNELKARIQSVELCPFLDKDQIFKTIDCLPETINPRVDKNWAYTHEYVMQNGEYVTVLKGIKPATQNLGYIIPRENKDAPRWEADTNTPVAASKEDARESQTIEQKRKKAVGVSYNSSPSGEIIQGTKIEDIAKRDNIWASIWLWVFLFFVALIVFVKIL